MHVRSLLGQVTRPQASGQRSRPSHQRATTVCDWWVCTSREPRRSCPARARSTPSGVDKPEHHVVVNCRLARGDQHPSLGDEPSGTPRRNQLQPAPKREMSTVDPAVSPRARAEPSVARSVPLSPSRSPLGARYHQAPVQFLLALAPASLGAPKAPRPGQQLRVHAAVRRAQAPGPTQCGAGSF